MIVKDKLDEIKAEEGYISGSLIVKSSDDNGVTYKWLCRYNTNNNFAYRREIFINTTTTEENIEDRTIGLSIEINPAK